MRFSCANFREIQSKNFINIYSKHNASSRRDNPRIYSQGFSSLSAGIKTTDVSIANVKEISHFFIKEKKMAYSTKKTWLQTVAVGKISIWREI